MQKLRLFGMNGVLALILVCLAGLARGQQAAYLILIDAENGQPFTARVGESLMSSSAHGHLLISQLRDSNYRVAIGFPRKTLPEQVFTVNMRKKDQAFRLQAAGDAWVLYNWQTRETLHPLKTADSSRLLLQGEKRGDSFSQLMAAVVNDSSVMYNSFTWEKARDSLLAKAAGDSAGELAYKKGVAGKAANPDGRQNGTRSVQQQDSARLAGPGKPASAEILLKTGSPAVHSPAPAHSTVKKLREVSLKISRKMVFTDTSPGGERDTITLFVYFEHPEKKPHEDPMVTARRLLRNDTAGAKAKQAHALPARDSTGKAPAVAGAAPPRPGNNCTQEATDSDVAVLRSAILVRNTLDEKISVASGAFAMKCFSVMQIRALAELFVSDNAKYRFLDTAHGHVSNADHFSELADLLLEKNYQKKFRNLLQKHG
jgi:hypothetical protein